MGTTIATIIFWGGLITWFIFLHFISHYKVQAKHWKAMHDIVNDDRGFWKEMYDKINNHLRYHESNPGLPTHDRGGENTTVHRANKKLRSRR